MFARLTRGELPGDLAGQPAMVGIIADEDSFDSVWTPRLHVAGAHFDYIRHIERVDGWTVDLSEDREGLKLAAELENVRVLYLDALLDNLGVNVDDWRTKQVRAALQPARSLASEFDIAVIGSMHPNKRADNFRQLVSGAAAFNALSRSSLLLAEHPDDDSRRVLARGKGNLSMAPRAMEFDIDSARFTANGHDFNEPKAVNFAESDLTADDLIGDAPTVREHSKVADAAEIIEALLPRDGQWHTAKDTYTACAAEGIDDCTVKRAKQRLGILHRRAQTFKAPTEWRWPTTEDTHRSSVFSDPSDPSVPSGSPTKDTQDTQDTQHTPTGTVPSGGANTTNDTDPDSLRASRKRDASPQADTRAAEREYAAKFRERQAAEALR